MFQDCKVNKGCDRLIITVSINKALNVGCITFWWQYNVTCVREKLVNELKSDNLVELHLYRYSYLLEILDNKTIPTQKLCSYRLSIANTSMDTNLWKVADVLNLWNAIAFEPQTMQPYILVWILNPAESLKV